MNAVVTGFSAGLLQLYYAACFCSFWVFISQQGTGRILSFGVAERVTCEPTERTFFCRFYSFAEFLFGFMCWWSFYAIWCEDTGMRHQAISLWMHSNEEACIFFILFFFVITRNPNLASFRTSLAFIVIVAVVFWQGKKVNYVRHSRVAFKQPYSFTCDCIFHQYEALSCYQACRWRWVGKPTAHWVNQVLPVCLSVCECVCRAYTRLSLCVREGRGIGGGRCKMEENAAPRSLLRPRLCVFPSWSVVS